MDVLSVTRQRDPNISPVPQATLVACRVVVGAVAFVLEGTVRWEHSDNVEFRFKRLLLKRSQKPASAG
jgi:hypothetical protein